MHTKPNIFDVGPHALCKKNNHIVNTDFDRSKYWCINNATEDETCTFFNYAIMVKKQTKTVYGIFTIIAICWLITLSLYQLHANSVKNANNKNK